MILDVNATRMELMRLKKRLGVARRGHKLLKDKQDELMRRFFALIERSKGLRKEVEDELQEALAGFVVARGLMSELVTATSLALPKVSGSVQVETKQVMNLKVPRLSVELQGNALAYGLASTPPELDLAVEGFRSVLPRLLELAELEKSIGMLARELERTRQRVNALEHKLIPDLTETIRYISLKLGERERGTLSRLMKVKEILEEQRGY
ncbi:MAG: V-type ATP synthase subunit D [Candidatus Coatesbacteria bacterium]|nr:V-type ATP synthase subunit D [Candidatus Coatesbacteria bacterium]